MRVLVLVMGSLMGVAGVTVTFNHEAKAPVLQSVKLAHGESFDVVIKNTVPDKFNYEIAGIVKASDDVSSQAADSFESYTLTHQHDQQFGGYYVNITKVDPSLEVKVGSSELTNAQFIIAVETVSWELEFTGGFTFSNVTDRVYAIKTMTDDSGQSHTVIQDHDAEDDQRLGVAAFINVYNERSPSWALTFGLGVNDSSDTTYYLGPTYRFSDKASVTLGYTVGSVESLPPGVDVDSTVMDPTILNNLGSKNEGGWFGAFSYKFLGNKNAFQKPFAGDSTTPAAGAESPSSTASPPAETPPTDSDNDGVVDEEEDDGS